MGMVGRRRLLRAAALLVAAAAAAAGLAGGLHAAAPHRALADNGVINSHN